MKKEIVTHFLFLIAFFSLITAFKKWFDIYYVVFWIGGVVGLALPYFDHLVYVYFLRPQNEISLRIKNLISHGERKAAFEQMLDLQKAGAGLIFHTAHFQLIFLVFAFFVITSSGSVFGRGIVLSFALHLLIDQVSELSEKGNIDSWFSKFAVEADADWRRRYVILNIAALSVLGFLF